MPGYLTGVEAGNRFPAAVDAGRRRRHAVVGVENEAFGAELNVSALVVPANDAERVTDNVIEY
jgi:hypothetical protein